MTGCDARLEKLGWGLLAILGILYLIFVVVVSALAFPTGLLSLVGMLTFGFIFLHVLRERLNNSEDDYYSKNVHQ